MAAPGIDIAVLLALLSPGLVFAVLLLLIGGWRLYESRGRAIWVVMFIAALGMVPVIFFESRVLRWAMTSFGDAVTGQIVAVLILAYVEEALKLLAVLFGAMIFAGLMRARPRTGIVLGAAAGLVFATIENVFYFIGFSDAGASWLWTVVAIRTLGTLPMHIVAGAMVGYYVVRARQSGDNGLLIYGILAAGTLHLAFNGIQIAGSYGTAGGGGMFALIVTQIAGIILVITTGLGVLHRARKLPDSRETPDRRPPPESSGRYPADPDPQPGKRGIKDYDDGPVIRR